MFHRSIVSSAGTALLVLAISPSAGADNFSLYFNKDADGVINYEECRLKKSKTVYYDCGNSLGDKLVIYASPSGACTNTPGTDAVILQSEHTISSSSDCSGTLSIDTSDVVGGECECDATKSLQLCAATKYQAYNYETLLTEWQEGETISLALTYDTKPPSTPVLEDVVPGDSSLHLQFSGASDVYEWVFCIEAVGSDDGDSSDKAAAGRPTKDGADGSGDGKSGESEDGDSEGGKEEGGEEEGGDDEDDGDAVCTAGDNPFADMDCFKTVTIKKSTSSSKGQAKGLENGVTYRVTMAARDLAGNYSGVSQSIEAAPIDVQDFFSAYKAAGGAEEGGFGCAAAGAEAVPAALAASVLAFPLAFRRGRRRSGEGPSGSAIGKEAQR